MLFLANVASVHVLIYSADIYGAICPSDVQM